MKTALTFFLKNYWILLILISVKLFLQFALVSPVYELHRDEFLHLDQSFHLSAGFISVPPLTSWVARLIYLFGGSLFWIRFFPALFGVLTLVFVWLIVEELGGCLAAKILASTFFVFSVYARMNILFQPNSFEVLAWTIMFFFLIRFVNSQRTRWLILLAIITALGLYNKYNIVFLIAGLFAGLILTQQRVLFTKRAFYIALALCLILFLPNLIWQIRHHFPVIYHMEALNERQLVNNNRMDFLLDQVKFGMIGIPTLAALWAFIFFKPFKPYRFIGLTFVIVLVLYTISRAKNYYAMGLYPVLFAIGSVYLEAILKKWSMFVVSLLVFVNMIIFFSIAKYLMPLQSPPEIIANRSSYEKIGLLRWEDGENHPLPQDYADMLGWREMADIAYKAYSSLPNNEKARTLIFTNNYGQVGALNYYNRNRMPKANSFNTDYLFWFPENVQLNNLIFVGDIDDDVRQRYKECQLVGRVENEYAREYETPVYLLRDAVEQSNNSLYQMVEERKTVFDCF